MLSICPITTKGILSMCIDEMPEIISLFIELATILYSIRKVIKFLVYSWNPGKIYLGA